ncbi:MAG: hypothetical protein ABW352_14825 [Polyangiales bacterium]
MSSLAEERTEDLTPEEGSRDSVTAYLRDRATPYAARVSAWWVEVTRREGCKPMSYYDQ